VLVVEDDRIVRLMMKRSLEEAGYRVLDAASAEQALHIIQDNSEIGLVLTDVVMPGGSGRELADRILELRPGTSVLFTSGYTDGEVERRGLLRAEAAFLQKPFTPQALVRTVGRELAARAGQREAGR
jgi:DNA-binding NtrC family response regulator